MTKIRDFMFVDNTLPKERLARYREMLTGVQHNAHCAPPKPAPGETIALQVTTSGDQAFDEVICRFTTD